MNIYQAVILKNPTSFKKADGSNQLTSTEIATHQNAMADFESHKADAKEISSVQLVETTFFIDLSYEDFKARLPLVLTWAGVKFSEIGGSYNIYLLE